MYKGFTIARTGLGGPAYLLAWEIKNSAGIVVASDMTTATNCKFWIDVNLKETK